MIKNMIKIIRGLKFRLLFEYNVIVEKFIMDLYFMFFFWGSFYFKLRFFLLLLFFFIS